MTAVQSQTSLDRWVPLTSGEISVNLCDLMRDHLFSCMMIDPVTPGKRLVWIDDDRPDTQAIVMECDEERALAILDVARLRHARSQIRFYRGRVQI